MSRRVTQELKGDGGPVDCQVTNLSQFAQNVLSFSTGSSMSWEPAGPRKTTLTQVPTPEVLIQCVWGGTWESAFLSGFPGDSSVHQGLRITVDQPGNRSARSRQRGERRGEGCLCLGGSVPSCPAGPPQPIPEEQGPLSGRTGPNTKRTSQLLYLLRPAGRSG